MTEDRRHTARPDTLIGFLKQLPALVLLQRLPMPMLAVCKDGTILYANPAFAAMLGQTENGLAGRPLNEFLVADRNSTPAECAETLRTASGFTAWHHPHNGTVKAVSSQPVLTRSDDPVVLVGLTDITEWLWTVEFESHPPTPLWRAAS
jgi:PAS domain S-box-containing protein